MSKQIDKPGDDNRTLKGGMTQYGPDRDLGL
jgi:hypothetical protein